jgi:general secretion pathway protein C
VGVAPALLPAAARTANSRAILSLDLLFKKYFYGILILMVLLAAYFQGSGISHLVRAQLSPGSGPTFAPMPKAAGKALTLPQVEPILARNPFDSETGCLNCAPETPVAEEEKKLTFDDPLTVPACPGVTVFIVTESDDPLWSFAAVQGQGDQGPKLRRVGDPIGDMKVAYIGYNPASAQPTIWLEGSTLCQAPLFSESEKTKPEPGAAAPAEGEPAKEPAADEGSKGGGSAIDPEIKSKIKQISETEFEIDRSAVEKILEDQAQLMRSARIVPEQKDGKTIGVRLFGVRPETLLGTLGLKNGDRLEQINGYDMGSPEKALEAYARLRTAENLKIKLNRRGQSTTIDFKIK